MEVDVQGITIRRQAVDDEVEVRFELIGHIVLLSLWREWM